ncbi:HD domain-containing protein [Labrys miyagiensis]|uniref:HD domain-containing protein n=1 Tax=Labrys miyagiensis TaxID=346912 RepID=A0ABQ6CKI9_9HYPH|nr:HD domain-containing protein [Labrys miyagiensis]GLS19390.1 HD domain-containing protein [Labrys miyagiensis]
MSGSEQPDFKDALAVGRTLGVTLADSRPVQDAYAEAQAESPDWLFNHVVRSWLYGARLTERCALKPDAEVVGVSVLLHDLGLARGGAPDRRFEVVGADAGRAFALAHNMGERRAETVWDAIALHTSPSIGHFKSADVTCSQHGIACDYGGAGYQQFTDGEKKAVLSTYPRLDMKKQLTTCLCNIVRNHPNTTKDNFLSDFGLKYVPGYTRMSAVDFLEKSSFSE